MADYTRIREQIASTGTLRVAINLANMLLVTDRAADGTPIGVSPDMAAAIAAKLEVPVAFTCFERVGETADAIGSGQTDIGLIAREAERAKTISFTPPYCEIEATYLVPPGSDIEKIEDVDIPGRQIAVANRAAYDLYLSRTIQHAELVRSDGLGSTFEMFRDRGLPVLAGLRPALLKNAALMPGSRVLEGNYTTIEQAVGTQHGKDEASAFLRDFVAEVCQSGFVGDAIRRHGVEGRLMVAGH